MERGDKEIDYINAIKSDVNPDELQTIVVLLSRKEIKAGIKKFLVEAGLISQFILANTVFSKSKALGVFSNLVKQINAKVGLDLYRI